MELIEKITELVDAIKVDSNKHLQELRKDILEKSKE